MTSPDQIILDENWSDLCQLQSKPDINFKRMHQYRIDRLKKELIRADVAMCLMVNPMSLRYAIDYQNYALFQSHIPSTYLFFPSDGPVVLHNGYDSEIKISDVRQGRPISFFDAGNDLQKWAKILANDVVEFLDEIGTNNRRVAVEYVNPTVTQALMERGLEVVDGVNITERAKIIKSNDEVECIRWAVAVAEHGAAKMREIMKPGVTELQLWGVLNYTNLANRGGWHEGHMLASGPRINPWLQSASKRKIESGDLVGFDTDMVGPHGYFADLSRTFHCGPAKPTARQKQLYQLAKAEVDHNLTLIKAGTSFSDLQKNAYVVPEEFQKNAYSCIFHGVGMCDEYPFVRPSFRGDCVYDGVLEAGMVICIESYMGAVGERDGVKLEEQVLVTESGYEMMTRFPFEDALL
ncbi:MAG: M24 family metallopeptidase [Gammaproteobacteria bacterium]|nr:M24 family metallopeptidase [Gammaproteobacteria bacterium]